jgi:hypothetical protein
LAFAFFFFLISLTFTQFILFLMLFPAQHRLTSSS